ncbi:MAG: hypothetical protein M5R41_02195 [Bacteroidia bacterium]|nr:hypothetical protein [Bacteroidia bacterium]
MHLLVRPHTALAFFLLLAVFSTEEGSAQRSVIPHGFAARYPGALTVGVSGGPLILLGSNGPTGTCDCVYDEGGGTGFNAGIAFDVYINPLLGLRVQGMFESHAPVFSKNLTRDLYSSDGSPVTVEAERRFEADLRYAGISMQLLWFTGAGDLFLTAGAGAGFFVDGTALDQETLNSPGVFYQQGSNRAVYHDGDLKDFADPGLRASLIVGIGYDLALARGLALAPEVQLDVPLTSVTSEHSEWKQLALRFNAALRLGI